MSQATQVQIYVCVSQIRQAHLLIPQCARPGGVLPYKGLIGMYGPPGYGFWGIFVLNRVWFWVKCLKQDIKIGLLSLSREGKLTIFVLNRIRV